MNIPFQRLNAIVKGRRAVSADTALLLDALTGWDAQIWLTLQSNWDLWHAMNARGRRPKVRPLLCAFVRWRGLRTLKAPHGGHRIVQPVEVGAADR